MAEGDGTVVTGTPTPAPGTPATTFGDWRDQLSTDLRTHETITSHKGTLSDFAKRGLDAEGKVKEYEGKLKTMIPKLPENATPEEVDVFFTALGKPEKATDYVIPDPDGGKADPKVVAWAQKTFHSAHLTKAQAEMIGKEFNAFSAGIVNAQVEARQQSRTAAETKLKAELGDGYDGGVEMAKRVWKRVLNEDIKSFLEDDIKGPLGNHPSIIKFLMGVGKLIGEDKGMQSNPQGVLPDGTVMMRYPDMGKK